MKMISMAALAALAMVQAVPAQATVFAFSYKAAAGTIAGRIEGTLLADHNTVAVDKVLDFVTFNGVDSIALPWLGTTDIIFFGSRAPTVTFDGSFVDFAACENDYCIGGEGVIFDPDLLAFFDPVVRTTAAFGNIAPADDFSPEPEIFSAAKWSLAEVPAVPEPATWGMMIAGFGLAAGAMRRRRVSVVFG